MEPPTLSKCLHMSLEDCACIEQGTDLTMSPCRVQHMCVPNMCELSCAGFRKHKSGMCAKLYMALGFIVEDSIYRHNVEEIIKPIAGTLRDPRDDEVDEGPNEPHSKLQV